VEEIYPELAEDFKAFMQVVRVCIERYEAGEEDKPITADEIRERFLMPERPLRNAFAMIGLVGLANTSSPGTPEEKGPVDWFFTVFWTIRKYRDVETIDDFLAERERMLDQDRKRMAAQSPLTTTRHLAYSALFPKPVPETRKEGAPSDEPASSSSPAQNTEAAAGYEFAAAFSFAGPQRELTERLATLVRDAGYKVFYDNFYADHLWGQDLPTFFEQIYHKKALYCVPFISQEYIDRMWTTWERRSATTRLLEERGKEYILPIRVENVEVPGIPSTIGYLSLSNYSIEQIAEILIKRLQRANAPRVTPEHREELPDTTTEKETQSA